MKNVLLCATGSVASIRIPALLDAFRSKGLHVKVVATSSALHFFTLDEVLTDDVEWHTWKKMGDPVLHIELRDWADACVIAPLDANTLSKLAHGLCDNLLTCVMRAWNVDKPVWIAPAMNTHMWHHPFTQQHLNILKGGLGYNVIDPVSKKLACGDVGMGGMASVDEIVRIVTTSLNKA